MLPSLEPLSGATHISNLATIQSVYAAFAAGDAAAAFANMSPQIIWNEAENFPYADRNPYVGPAAIGEGVFFRLATEWKDFAATPQTFHDAGDTILTLGRYTATNLATGQPLDAQFAHVWSLANGKVTAFQQFTDTFQARRATQTLT